MTNNVKPVWNEIDNKNIDVNKISTYNTWTEDFLKMNFYLKQENRTLIIVVNYYFKTILI